MKIHVGVMFGGASVEHEISILTAMQVLEHINQEIYDVIPIYCAKNHTLYHDDCLWDVASYKDLNALVNNMASVALYNKEGVCYMRPMRMFKKEVRLDFILPIFHGTNGEDGTIQGFLRMLQVPFCGSDILGASIGQDKVIMKEILSYHNVPICPWCIEDCYTYDASLARKRSEELGWPVIVKPANLGSSVGIHIVHSEKELDLAIQNAFLYDRKVVIEKVITNVREFNCSVIGDQENAQTSCIEEVLKKDNILSYHDKYECGTKGKGMQNTTRVLPAQIDDEAQKLIEELSLQTFHSLQASGVVRIDFLQDVDTNMIYVNEINTIPGSLSFYLWAPKEISFTALLDQIIALGIKKHRHQEKMIFSYASNVLSSYQGGIKGTKL